MSKKTVMVKTSKMMSKKYTFDGFCIADPSKVPKVKSVVEVPRDGNNFKFLNGSIEGRKYWKEGLVCPRWKNETRRIYMFDHVVCSEYISV